MKNANIVLDFSTNNVMDSLLAGQPLAVMPAELAKKLLINYASNLRNAKAYTIINNHVETLVRKTDVNDLSGAIEASISWIQERDLIDNVSKENWDAYKVQPQVMA